jgi:2'-5' RNA ligase
MNGENQYKSNKNMNNTKNFSINANLEGEAYKKVRELQQKLSEITGSKKSLVDWHPHITLSDAIIASENELKKLEVELSNFSHSQNSIKVNITGWGGTDNWRGAVKDKVTPYIIWLEVKVSPDLLHLFNDLRERITSHYGVWLPRMKNYVPHVTLAFADLSEDGYRKGMEYLATQKFESAFTISNIALIECYGEGNMTSAEYKKFYFRGIS